MNRIGLCDICGSTEKQIVKDRDPRTNKRRGTLCNMCNDGLSYMHDRPQLLRKGADYIEHYLKSDH